MKSTLLPKLISIFLFSLCSLFTNAQLTFDWALSQGSKVSDHTSSMKQDDQGHLYTLDFIRDTSDLNPGAGEEIFVPWFDESPVLTKWTTDGDFLWSGAFQTPGSTGGAIMQLIDSHMLLYLYYTDSIVYVRQNQSTRLSANPGEHICALTLDLDGNVISFRDLSDSFGLYFSYLAALPDGQILASGAFYNPLTLSMPNGDTTIVPQGEDDAFIILYDANWQPQWVRTIASDDYDYIGELYVSGNTIYYAAGYNDTLTVNTVNGPVTFPCNAGEENGLFGTLSLDGTALTAQSFGDDLNDEIRAITSDTEGNIYICGSFEGEVNFEHPDAPPVTFTSVNLSDGFVSKYSPEGFLQWTRIIKDSEYGGMHNMKLQRDEFLYLTGGYNGRTDLDPGPDSIIMETTNWGDIYSIKFDKEGQMQWVYSFSGDELEGIVTQIISPDARVFLMGFHYDVFDADPSENEFIVPNRGGTDMFIIGLTEENVITSAEQPDEFDLTLSPNPASTEIIISGNSPIEQVMLYTMNGAIATVPVSYASDAATLQVSALQPGVYVARIKTANAYSCIRFVRL